MPSDLIDYLGSIFYELGLSNLYINSFNVNLSQISVDAVVQQLKQLNSSLQLSQLPQHPRLWLGLIKIRQAALSGNKQNFYFIPSPSIDLKSVKNLFLTLNQISSIVIKFTRLGIIIYVYIILFYLKNQPTKVSKKIAGLYLLCSLPLGLKISRELGDH